MKILQLDVDRIEFQPVRQEAKVYEPAEKTAVSVENALVLLVSIEKGDSTETGKKAVDDAVAFARKQKVEKLVVYPFAHLSDNLASPNDALSVLKGMRDEAAKGAVIEKLRALGYVQ